MGIKRISGKLVKFAIYLVAVVLLNLAGLTLFYRLDLTQNKIYSISEASRAVVSTLSEPLTINVFFTKNLPAPHNTTERYLHDLLEEYASFGGRQFNYRFYNVSADGNDLNPEAKDSQELAQNYGIHPVQIQAIDKDEVKFQKAYMGLVLIHGDLIERIPTITSTDGLEYKLTTAIRKLNNKVSALLSLPENIRVKLILSSSLNSVAPYLRLNQLITYPREADRIVTKLNSQNYGKLSFEHLDPTKNPDLADEVTRHGVMNLKWPDIPGKTPVPAGDGAAGVVLEYRDKAVTIPLIQVLQIPIIGTQYDLLPIEQLEEVINENLESLIDINQDIGVLADHGAITATGFSPTGAQNRETVRNFRKLAAENYTLKNVMLKEETIPDGFNTLILAGPTESFTDWELYQIDQYLMKGNNLAIFLDAFQEVMPQNQQAMMFGGGQPQYLPLDTGLEKLLEHYGVRLKSSYVMDENCYKQRMPAQYGGGERNIYFAPVIKQGNINDDLKFMASIKGLIGMRLSPLELDTERIKANNLTAHRLLTSSDKSWEMTGQINLNPMFIRPPDSADKMKAQPLAYLLEGEFPSYFAGKPVPEKPAPEEAEETIGEDSEPKKSDKTGPDLSGIKHSEETIDSGKPARIFIIGSSAMISDNILDEEGRSPNSMFVMNVLDSLNDRDDVAVMRSKEQRFNPLVDSGPGIKTALKTANIGGLPVLVVIFGLGVWARRHARKKRIQQLFQK